jgi:uncharacterized protein
MNTRILVICGDAWHPAADVRQGLSPLNSLGFDFEFLDYKDMRPVNELMNYSIVVLAKANMISPVDHRPWMTPDMDGAFFNFVRSGGGLVVMHAGTSRYEQWPMMHDLIGGAFSHHPEPCLVTVEPLRPHPLTHGLAPFTVPDEHYFMSVENSKMEVFLHSRSEYGLQPAGWIRVEGKGRVCVLTPGHTKGVWLHPQYQRLLLNAFQWTAKLN